MSQIQLTIEASTKAIISLWVPPTRKHDPSNQFKKLIKENEKILGDELVSELNKLAIYVKEVAPEHAFSNYGDEKRLLLPSELYERDEVKDYLEKALWSVKLAEKIGNIIK
jgi:hypothetical protein